MNKSDKVLEVLDKIKIHYIKFKGAGLFEEKVNQYDIILEILEVLEQTHPKKKLRLIK